MSGWPSEPIALEDVPNLTVDELKALATVGLRLISGRDYHSWRFPADPVHAACQSVFDRLP